MSSDKFHSSVLKALYPTGLPHQKKKKGVSVRY